MARTRVTVRSLFKFIGVTERTGKKGFLFYHARMVYNKKVKEVFDAR